MVPSPLFCLQACAMLTQSYANPVFFPAGLAIMMPGSEGIHVMRRARLFMCVGQELSYAVCLDKMDRNGRKQEEKK